MTTLTGTGTLRADGKDIGKISYRILVTQRGPSKSAAGTFSGEPSILTSALDARSTTLVRDDNGFEMKVVLTQVHGDGTGTLAVSGPPGPGI